VKEQPRSIFIDRLPHPVWVGESLLGRLDELLPRELREVPAALVWDSKLPGPLVATVSDRLRRRLALEFSVPAGEAAKTWQEAGRLLEMLAAARLPREAVLISLGGGAVCDLVGFCAAVYQRGVALVHLPTTVLAQVDASIGGKTGVNLGGVKNQVGAFHQPRMVLADLTALRSLSEQEIWSGLGEVVKMALLRPERLWARVAGQLPVLVAAAASGSAAPLWLPLVAECIEAKLEIVSGDERDAGGRAALNLGHTVGHALEAAARGLLPHGLAVVSGLRAALRLSERRGWLGPADLARGLDLLTPFPLSAASPDREIARAALLQDKKRTARGLRFVLLRGLGRPELTEDLPMEWVVEELDRALAES
jgi:3-dehydroquinate synthase